MGVYGHEGQDAETLARGLRHEDGWAWSSAYLDESLVANALEAQGPPEPLLRALWTLIPAGPVTPNHYEFCRDLNRHALGRYRDHPGWSLAWLRQAPPSAAHACFQFWLMALRVDFFSEAHIARVEAALPLPWR